jgi:outer membrane protein OmpA-like peptidoglycan-associated protein
MRLRNAMLAATFLATPVAAFAQPIDGLYIGAGAGLHAPQDPRATPYGRGFRTGRVELNEGYGFNSELAVGYGLGNGFRFEIEGDFMRDNVRHLDGTPFPTAASGHVRTWGAMVNAIYDMDIGFPYIYPYLGAGAGYQWTRLSNVTAVNAAVPFATAVNTDKGAFAWQAIVGASLPIPGVPGLSGTADYRFMDILGGEKYSGVTTTAAGTAGSQLKLHNQFDHEVVLGVRYAFNTPAPAVPVAPAPVVAPAPAPARSYLVFFDWDKAALTDRARAIIKEAADNSTRVQYTRIEVNGYTDTSGSAQYNQGLSVRRAQAVAGELVRDGVPRNAITAQGFGDTHLLVSTGPGVREPQNRRVEIIVR